MVLKSEGVLDNFILVVGHPPDLDLKILQIVNFNWFCIAMQRIIVCLSKFVAFVIILVSITGCFKRLATVFVCNSDQTNDQQVSVV